VSVALDFYGQGTFVARSGDKIAQSTDSGATYTDVAAARDWTSIAASADGTTVAATVANGQIWVSRNHGVTWSPRENVRNWYQVVMSASGEYIYAADNGGYMYLSTDYGVNWASTTSIGNWFTVATSTSGEWVFLCAMGGNIFASSNYGAGWYTYYASSKQWHSIAISDDASTVLAAEYGGYLWVDRPGAGGILSAAHEDQWFSVAVTPSGSLMAAVAFGGYLYTSNDRGYVWARYDSPRDWHSVALARGTVGTTYALAAVDNAGYIYRTAIEDPNSTLSKVIWDSANNCNGYLSLNNFIPGSEFAQRIRTSADGPGHITRVTIPVYNTAIPWEVLIATDQNPGQVSPNLDTAQLVLTVPIGYVCIGNLVSIELGFPVAASQDIWFVIRPVNGYQNSNAMFWYSTGCASRSAGDAFVYNPPVYDNNWIIANPHKIQMTVWEKITPQLP
jgi:hypothetical protein